MPDTETSLPACTVTIVNKRGLHARASANGGEGALDLDVLASHANSREQDGRELLFFDGARCSANLSTHPCRRDEGIE